MHGYDERYWKPIYTKFLTENNIKKIVVDVFPRKKGQYSLDFKKILPVNYRMIDILGPYKGEKYIEIYGKDNK